MSEPQVINYYRPRGPYVYVGRPSMWGNPFPLKDTTNDAHRAQVIEQFKLYFYARIERDPAFRASLIALRGRDLGCFCAPKPCHADIILAYVNRPQEGGDA